MANDKVLSYLGLATKAGKIQSGEFSTEKSVKCGKAALVIVAEDASDNTKKKFKNMCSFYEVPCFVYGTKVALGDCIGKEFRASLALEDPGFCKAILKQIDSEQI